MSIDVTDYDKYSKLNYIEKDNFWQVVGDVQSPVPAYDLSKGRVAISAYTIAYLEVKQLCDINRVSIAQMFHHLIYLYELRNNKA